MRCRRSAIQISGSNGTTNCGTAPAASIRTSARFMSAQRREGFSRISPDRNTPRGWNIAATVQRHSLPTCSCRICLRQFDRGRRKPRLRPRVKTHCFSLPSRNQRDSETNREHSGCRFAPLRHESRQASLPPERSCRRSGNGTPQRCPQWRRTIPRQVVSSIFCNSFWVMALRRLGLAASPDPGRQVSPFGLNRLI